MRELISGRDVVDRSSAGTRTPRRRRARRSDLARQGRRRGRRARYPERRCRGWSGRAKRRSSSSSSRLGDRSGYGRRRRRRRAAAGETRIEANPLEVVQALEAAALQAGAQRDVRADPGADRLGERCRAAAGAADRAAQADADAERRRAVPRAGQLPTVVANESSKPPVKSAAAYKATVVHEAQRPPRDAAQAPTMAAPPIDPNHGAMPSMTLDARRADRLAERDARLGEADARAARDARLAGCRAPERGPRADAPTQPPPTIRCRPASRTARTTSRRIRSSAAGRSRPTSRRARGRRTRPCRAPARSSRTASKRRI